MAKDPNSTQQVDVELLAEGGDIAKAMDLINAKIEKASLAVQKIVTSADQGSKKFDNQLNRTVKDLQQAMSQLSTLEKSIYSGAGGVRQLRAAEKFGKDTEAAARFAGTVKNAGTAVEAVGARINDLTKKMGALGQQDFLPKQKMLRAQNDLRDVERQLKSVDSTLTRLGTKSRLNGGDFSGQQKEVLAAQAALFKALQDGRRTNFAPEMQRLQDATAKYALDLRTADAELRRMGQSYDQLVQKARAYTTETNFQREGRLRRESGRLAVPGDVSTEGAAERLAQATLRAANARERLNTALRSNAGQAELAKAVSEYELYNRELVEAIALHDKLQRELKQSAAEQAAQAARAAKEQAATQLPKAQPKGPLQSILSPGYAVAAFARTSVYGAAAMAAYSIFNAVRDGAQFVIQFEDTLARLQAIAGATSGQMVDLRDKILEVGTTSKYSTLELAEAAITLAQAGFSASDMGSSLEAVSRLAVASGSTIAESVDLITGAIGAFQLQTSEAARVSDLLVAALNRSKLTVTQVAQAIQYVGATAFESNISLNELVAAAGAISQAGVRSGSTIGTGLRQFLVDLQDPTKKLTIELTKLGLTQADVDVKTRGLSTVLTTLRDAGFGSAQAYAGLETRAAAAFLVLKNNLGTMHDLEIAQLAQGQAAEAAGTAMESLSAEWQRFKNIVNKQSAESDFLNGIKDGFRDLLEGAGELIRANEKMAESRLGIYDQTKKNLDQYSQEGRYLDALGASFELMGMDIDNAVRATVGMNQQFKSGAGSAQDYETAIANGNEVINAYQVTIAATDKELAKLLLQEATLKGEHGALASQTAMLATRFEGLSKYLNQNTNDFYGAIKAVREYRAELYATLQTQLTTQKGLLTAQRTQQRGEALGAFRRADRNVTSTEGRQILMALARNPTDPIIRQAALDYSKRSGVSSFEAKSIADAARAAAGFDTTNRNLQIVNRQSEYVAAGLNPNAQRSAQGVETVTAALGQMDSRTGGMSGKQRAQLYTPIADEARNASDAARARAKEAANEGERQYWNDQADQWNSLSNQAKAAMSTLGEKTPKAKTDRAGAREARRRLAARKTVSDAALKSAELDLKEALDDNTQPRDFSDFKDGREEIERALSAWVEKRLDLMKDEIASKHMTGTEAENFEREVRSQIASKQTETRKKIADLIVDMLANGLKAADRAFERAMQPYEDGIKLAEARVSSLDRVGVRNRVPDYVRANAAYGVELQQEQRDRASVSANDTRIAEYLAQLGDAKAAIRETQQALGSENLGDDIVVTSDKFKDFSGQTLKDVREAIADTEVKIHDLTVANEALRASFDGASQIPQTLGEAFQQASAAYARSVGLNRTMKESIINDLGGAISETHDAFTQFWNDMLSRPQDVLNNLKNFALAVGRILQQMAAQALANQIFGSILNLVGMGTNAGLSSAGKGLGSSIGSIIPRFNGGSIDRAEGGLVTEGVPNRDSVNTNLARGEFVTRKAAVDSVGVEFMRDVNKRGIRALRGLAGTPMIAPAPKQEMAVYLVAPEERPSLGPNDVVAVMNNEMLKDGSTKKLIKYIAQGG